MKKLALAALAVLGLASCTSVPTQPNAPVIPGLTPQQIATQICPALQVTIPAMQAIVGLPEGVYAQLKVAQSSSTILCSTAATLTTTDAQSLEQIAFQVVLPLVEASNPKLAAELEAAQIIVGFANAIQAGAEAGAQAGSSIPAKPTAPPAQ